jgi:hypothetical protein
MVYINIFFSPRAGKQKNPPGKYRKHMHKTISPIYEEDKNTHKKINVLTKQSNNSNSKNTIIPSTSLQLSAQTS